MPDTNDSKANIVNEIGNAYRSTPLLTGMLLLIMVMFGAIGWYEVRNDDRVYEYVKMRDKMMIDSFQQMVGLALGCRLPDVEPKTGSPKTIAPVPVPPPPPDPTHRTTK